MDVTMGYASWTEDRDKERNDSVVAPDKQWSEPVIFKHNGRRRVEIVEIVETYYLFTALATNRGPPVSIA